MVYTNDNTDYSRLSAKQRFVLQVQDYLTGSYYAHIAAGIDTKDGIVCYEIIAGETARCGYKTADHYEKKIQVEVTKKQYKDFLYYLNDQVKNQVKFNDIGYAWNFIPILSWCKVKGSGKYCAQLLADALVYADIIDIDKKVLTDGYTTKSIFGCCCCCFPSINTNRGRKIVKISPTYAITVKMLWDVIKDQTKPKTLSTKINMNRYHIKLKKRGRRRKRKRRRRKIKMKNDKNVGIENPIDNREYNYLYDEE